MRSNGLRATRCTLQAAALAHRVEAVEHGAIAPQQLRVLVRLEAARRLAPHARVEGGVDVGEREWRAHRKEAVLPVTFNV